MKFKVCGLKESANMLDVSELKPDYIGLIFWSKSKRFVKDSTPELPNEIKKLFKDKNIHKGDFFGGNKPKDMKSEAPGINIDRWLQK